MLRHVSEDSVAPYRLAAPLPPDPFAPSWAGLRRRRLAVWVLWLSFLPVMATAGFFLRGRPLTYVFWPLALTCLIARLAAILFPCPRCGGSFGYKPFESRRWTLPRQCLHCGIAIGTPAKP
jgi:hypothetical protein